MAFALALILGVAVTAAATRDAWLPGDPVDGTQVTLNAVGADGAAPSAEELDQAAAALAERMAQAGVDGEVTAQGPSDVVVTVVGADASALYPLLVPGQLRIRPVVKAWPAADLAAAAQNAGAEPGASPSSQPPAATPAVGPRTTAPDAEKIRLAKELRQSTNQNVLLYAGVPFTAMLCGKEDVLAGNDDPELPLVTCSQDGEQVYLLDKSIISGEEIADATSGLDPQLGEHVVNLQFNDTAAVTWADFSSANIGTQTAFTLDTAVVSAPQIRGPIPNGNTQITGTFTADSARDLVAVLNAPSALPGPLILVDTAATTIPGDHGSRVVQAALLGTSALALLLLGAASLSRRHRQAART